jgi:hypothetical protein
LPHSEQKHSARGDPTIVSLMTRDATNETNHEGLLKRHTVCVGESCFTAEEWVASPVPILDYAID